MAKWGNTVELNRSKRSSLVSGGTGLHRIHTLGCGIWIFLALPGLGIYHSGDILLWTPFCESGTRVRAFQANPQ